MLLQKKQGYPADDELVLCSVMKISPHSVFVRLEEYDKSGMIHISEISPGRIRNIRDFVREGKVIVCKVLRTNPEKGYIDLSLRRVNELQRKTKSNEIKQEQKAEKIVEYAAKKLKLEMKTFFPEIIARAAKFDSLYDCFESVVEKGVRLEELGISAAAAKELEEAIRQRIKPAEVRVGGELTLTSYEPDGIEIIRKSVASALEAGSNVELGYEGGGKYRVLVKAHDYKEGEKALKKATDNAIAAMRKGNSHAEFARKEFRK